VQGLLKVSPLVRTTETEIFAAGLFRGRTALATGGGAGIGLAIARELGRLGPSVVIAARCRRSAAGQADGRGEECDRARYLDRLARRRLLYWNDDLRRWRQASGTPGRVNDAEMGEKERKQ
jgi:NAD(P)-dependent dehydrogenase (short-subunit alcohol dehydrogenase family)